MCLVINAFWKTALYVLYFVFIHSVLILEKSGYTLSMQPKHSVRKNTITNDIFQTKIYKWLGTVAFPADVDVQVSINPNDLLHIASFVGH